MIKDSILQYLHDKAEYFSASLTYAISFISLNIHFSHVGEEMIIKIAAGMISLAFTALAVVMTHFIKRYLDRRHK